MNIPTRIISGLMISALLCGASVAATPSQTPRAPAPQADCQKVGGEVSALIDKRTDSPNIAAARSVFQVGIMECMEGSDDAATGHYLEAKKLLGGDQPKPNSSNGGAPAGG